MSAAVQDRGALRAEHDSLARELSARRSIDEARKAIYTGFFGLLALATSGKLAWDRWFSERLTRFRGPPVFFYCAIAISAVALLLALRWWILARRHMRVEDERFARLRALRAELGLDP